MLIPFLLSLITMIMWGTMDVLAGLLGRRAPVLAGFFLNQLLGFLLMLVFLPLFPAPAQLPWVQLMLLGILPVFTWIFYLYAAQFADISIVGPISRIDFVITSALGMVFLAEAATPIKIFSILIVLVGGMLLSFNLRALGKLQEWKTQKGALLSLCSAIALGFLLFFLAPASREAGWYYTALVLRFAVTLYAGIILVVKKEANTVAKKGLPWKIIAGIALVDVVGLSVYNWTVTYYPVSYVSVIVSCASLVTLLISRIFLKERLRMLQYIGVVGILLGIILLQVG